MNIFNRKTDREESSEALRGAKFGGKEKLVYMKGVQSITEFNKPKDKMRELVKLIDSTPDEKTKELLRDFLKSYLEELKKNDMLPQSLIKFE